jgi:hypothetical protein
MVMKLPLEGGCLCGAVRYRIDAAPDHAGYCHCRMCQRATGAPVVAWLIMARNVFAWTKGQPIAYRSSATAERLFCGVCGSQLGFRELAEPQNVEITVASLDEPAAVRPSQHIWTSSRIPWFDVADDLPRYPEHGPNPPR